MKIIVTQADLEKLIRSRLATSSISDGTNIDVVFDNPPPATVGNYIEGLHRAMYEFPRYMTDQKIQAIKRFRELVPGMGLCEAKMAVENHQAAIAHFLRSGTFYR